MKIPTTIAAVALGVALLAPASPAAAETIHNYVEKRTTCAGHESRVVEEIHSDGGELIETRYTAWKVDRPLTGGESADLGCVQPDECPTKRVDALAAKVEAKDARIDSLRAKVERLRNRLHNAR